MRILLVAPAWVGDMVMAHALVQVLQSRHEDADIDIVAPAATAPLAERMPGVSSGRRFEVEHGELALGRRWTLGRALGARGYDQAIVLPNTFKSALVPWWAGIPQRTGWHGESRFVVLNDRRQLDAARYPLMIERFMALGLEPGADLPEPCPTPRLTVDQGNRQRLMETLSLNADRPVLALCPGAEFGPAKRWPAAHFAAVARRAAQLGQQVWLFGSPGERSACDGIAALAPQVINLAGRTQLVDAVDLLSVADTVVSNDSGLMHVAGAVGVRVVAVFGSTSPTFTPPLGAGARVVRLDLPCSPCFQRTCPLGHRRCLEELAPERVIGLL